MEFTGKNERDFLLKMWEPWLKIPFVEHIFYLSTLEY